MGILTWIVFGAIVGWLASVVMGTNEGLLTNIIIGIIGSVLGNWLAGLLGFGGVRGFNLHSFIVALIGAVVLIFIAKKLF